jgi:hypothetical protein
LERELKKIEDLERILSDDVFFMGGIDKKNRGELGNKAWSRMNEIKMEMGKEKKTAKKEKDKVLYDI